MADVDVATEVKDPLRDAPAQVLASTFLDRFVRQQRLELCPQRDPFEQRARGVAPRRTGGENGIQVEVAVDKRRRDKALPGINFHVSWTIDPGLDGGDAAVRHGDVDGCVVARASRSADDQIDPGEA